MRTALAALVLSAIASAATITSDLRVTGGGPVSVYYLGAESAYTSDLYFGDTLLFNNGPGPTVGTRFDLGYIPDGTQLQFSLHVRNTGLTFVSGSGNPDGYMHFNIYDYIGDPSLPNGVMARVEDLWRGGDKDHNDLVFVVAILGLEPDVPVPTPEPGALALVGLGLMGIWMRRKK